MCSVSYGHGDRWRSVGQAHPHSIAAYQEAEALSTIGRSLTLFLLDGWWEGMNAAATRDTRLVQVSGWSSVRRLMLLLRKGLPKQGIVRWWWSRRLSWERVYRCHAITSKGLCRSLDSSPPQREPPAAAACHRGKTLSLSSGSALSSSLSLAHTPLSPPLHLSLSPLSLSLSTLSRMDVPTRTLARIVVFEEGVSGKRTKVLPCSNATVASLQEALLHKLCSDHFGTRAPPLPLLLQTHAEPFSLSH